MILFQPGTVVWAMLALGAITTLGPTKQTLTTERSSGIAAATCGLFALAVLVLGFTPQTRQDRLLDSAAKTVASIAVIRGAWPSAAREVAQGPPGNAALQMLAVVRTAGGIELEARVKAAMTTAADPRDRVASTAQALQRFDANQRALAADILKQADAVFPHNRVGLEAAVKQLAAAGRRTLGPRRAEIVEPLLHADAMHVAALAADRFGGPRFPAMLADLMLERARADGSSEVVNAAVIAVRRASALQPYRPSLYADLGDLLAFQRKFEEAAVAYRRALAVDADLELDPLAGFSDRQQAEIESRLSRVEGAISDPTTLPEGWPLQTH